MDAIAPLAVNPTKGAKVMGVSRSTFYQLLRNGELPLIKIGTRSLIRIADIESKLAELALRRQR
jgi:excisionase family DNA binding protein